MKSLKDELVKAGMVKISTLLEIAIGKLIPIEFEIEGIEASILPTLGRVEREKFEKGKKVYLRIYHASTGAVVMADNTSHYYEYNYKRGCGGMIIPIEGRSQSEVDAAIQALWKAEEKSLLYSPKVFSIQAWSQGNDIYKDIEILRASHKRSLVVSWKKFCKFSQNFTNGAEMGSFKESLVYLDNSGGFKCRGAFESKPKLSYYDSEKINLSLPAAKSKKGEEIKHHFGEWDAYEFHPNQIFVFGSCNGNYLLGETLEGGDVRVSLGNLDSNYAKFFLSKMIK